MCCAYCKKELKEGDICFCFFNDISYDDWGKPT